MTKQEILTHIDHNQLKAFCTWENIKKLCDEAIKYNTASVCIPLSYIERIKETYGDKINICTVIGFPLGYNTTETKVFEVKDAIAKGCSEVDVVINIGHVKNGDFDKVEAEIKALKEAAGDKILKVIIETCYLTDDEKVKLCQCVTNAKADYIKTSTGFGTGGATFEDVALMKKYVGDEVEVKAAGGIRDANTFIKMIQNGATRIGTSAGVSIIEELKKKAVDGIIKI